MAHSANHHDQRIKTFKEENVRGGKTADVRLQIAMKEIKLIRQELYAHDKNTILCAHFISFFADLHETITSGLGRWRGEEKRVQSIALTLYSSGYSRWRSSDPITAVYLNNYGFRKSYNQNYFPDCFQKHDLNL
jgi:hypothetical protein